MLSFSLSDLGGHVGVHSAIAVSDLAAREVLSTSPARESQGKGNSIRRPHAPPRPRIVASDHHEVWRAFMIITSVALTPLGPTSSACRPSIRDRGPTTQRCHDTTRATTPACGVSRSGRAATAYPRGWGDPESPPIVILDLGRLKRWTTTRGLPSPRPGRLGRQPCAGRHGAASAHSPPRRLDRRAGRGRGGAERASADWRGGRMLTRRLRAAAAGCWRTRAGPGSWPAVRQAGI